MMEYPWWVRLQSWVMCKTKGHDKFRYVQQIEYMEGGAYKIISFEWRCLRPACLWKTGPHHVTQV